MLPFLTDHLWRALVADPCPDAPQSIFRTPWPEPDDRLADTGALEAMAQVRQVVELGRRRARRATSACDSRCDEPSSTAARFAVAHAGEIAAELRPKEVRFEEDVVQRMRLKPKLRLLGPRLGRDLPAVRTALEAGRYELLDTGAVTVAGMILGPDEVLRERRPVNEG